MKYPKDLYIITTAAKRDTLDWEREASFFGISKNREASICNILMVVDSWNNIGKYLEIKDAFFIFDEQRVIGSGAWVKSFLKITKTNNWILLTATPGDTWMDYIPVFIANGFYKNRTEFLRNHVIYNRFSKFPKVDHYVERKILEKHKEDIIVLMPYEKPTISNYETIITEYDKNLYQETEKKRWHVYEKRPIKDIAELCFVLRKIVNSDPSRLQAVRNLALMHRKVIVFYNFNYELEQLHSLSQWFNIAEYNGHKHEAIPTSESWIYLVQYLSGAEGWNCTTSNTVIFYSQNYSYRIKIQAAGRIDRLNTPFSELYYYTLRSMSSIDMAILKALINKEDFNESQFTSKFKETNA
jgi:hypothetical protein